MGFTIYVNLGQTSPQSEAKQRLATAFKQPLSPNDIEKTWQKLLGATKQGQGIIKRQQIVMAATATDNLRVLELNSPDEVKTYFLRQVTNEDRKAFFEQKLYETNAISPNMASLRMSAVEQESFAIIQYRQNTTPGWRTDIYRPNEIVSALGSGSSRGHRSSAIIHQHMNEQLVESGYSPLEAIDPSHEKYHMKLLALEPRGKGYQITDINTGEKYIFSKTGKPIVVGDKVHTRTTSPIDAIIAQPFIKVDKFIWAKDSRGNWETTEHIDYNHKGVAKAQPTKDHSSRNAMKTVASALGIETEAIEAAHAENKRIAKQKELRVQIAEQGLSGFSLPPPPQ